ncbi:ATP-dependent DNA helicase RecG [Brevundimonas sp. 2R-24]|uniref:ATP-dependent DNA helicase RecG n=1 Tax=Peiella sedimenti TaxID=3061083 RepID=A0ABT8SJ87_9CAUL|nr:ATP-dependent DNA helicase RecG [Caulobacteraceae bacterium XZ-24]
MRPEILFPLFAETATLKGVGAKVEPIVRRLAGPRVRDVLFTGPTGLIRRAKARANSAVEGQVQIFTVTIDRHVPSHKIGAPYRVRAYDETGFVHLVYFKTYGDSLLKQLPVGETRVVSGKVEFFNGEVQIPHPDFVLPSERADEIPAVEPVYPGSANFSSRQFRKVALNALEKAPELPEWQDPAWLAARRWPSWHGAITALHHPLSEAELDPLSPARARLAYDELLAHQIALAKRRRQRQAKPGPRIAPSEAGRRLIAALPFALTGDQRKACDEIGADLQSGQRMGRLLQGDVGSGKTVVAALAAVETAAAGYQAAFMAPTEILARQHHERLVPLLEAAGVTSVLLTGRDKGASRAEKLAALAEGRAQVAFGTHALFQDAVAYKALGLAVIDEQHRFGVAERDRLVAKGEAVHLLAMSATPIPRTLELAQFGDLDVSRLLEKPPGRKPVTTRVLPLARADEAIERLDAAARGGAQAYWICPMVSESEVADLAAAEERARDLTERLSVPVGLVHGQMDAAERDAAMTAFAEGRTAVLVATTVVEVGVDVPNATIMVVEHAERFGLAQLHQLRGRIGRGAAHSACLLLQGGGGGEATSQRLQILRETDDGFRIAEEDFALRGGGDPLGLKQSGFPAYRFADPHAHRELMLAAADDARLVLQGPLKPDRKAALGVLTSLFDWREAVTAAG